MKTYKEAYQEAAALLLQADVPNADVDAWYLLSHVTKITRTEYLMHPEGEMSSEQSMQLSSLVRERMTHRPLQYILSEQEFMGLTFYVDEAVLIPRQDTEILVEEALKISDGKDVLDVCTGSGCIIVSIAALSKVKSASAIDISPDALAVAKKNARTHQTDVMFYQSNMFEAIRGTYDIIVSNPPYIPSSVCETLMPEVKEFEPRLALDGTEDGLEFYRILARDCKKHLSNDGTVLFEIGCEQAADVSRILAENGYYNIKTIQDYAHLDRVVTAQYANKE